MTSADVTLTSGEYGPSAYAVCPSGTSVIGTGFYSSLASVGFVEAFSGFVGGYFDNQSLITLTGLHVQAICASVAPYYSSSMRSSAMKSDLHRFKIEVARATAIARSERR